MCTYICYIILVVHSRYMNVVNLFLGSGESVIFRVVTSGKIKRARSRCLSFIVYIARAR